MAGALILQRSGGPGARSTRGREQPQHHADSVTDLAEAHDVRASLHERVDESDHLSLAPPSNDDRFAVLGAGVIDSAEDRVIDLPDVSKLPRVHETTVDSIIGFARSRRPARPAGRITPWDQGRPGSAADCARPAGRKWRPARTHIGREVGTAFRHDRLLCPCAGDGT